MSFSAALSALASVSCSCFCAFVGGEPFRPVFAWRHWSVCARSASRVSSALSCPRSRSFWGHQRCCGVAGRVRVGRARRFHLLGQRQAALRQAQRRRDQEAGHDQADATDGRMAERAALRRAPGCAARSASMISSSLRAAAQGRPRRSSGPSRGRQRPPAASGIRGPPGPARQEPEPTLARAFAAPPALARPCPRAAAWRDWVDLGARGRARKPGSRSAVGASCTVASSRRSCLRRRLGPRALSWLRS